MLLRKVLKKSGQLCEVKFVPRDVSNGEGNAVGAIVLEGMVSVAVGLRDVAEREDELALEAVALVSV